MKRDVCLSLDELGITSLHKVREIDGHGIYFRSYNPEVSLDTTIFRYMRLSTLLDMHFYSVLRINNRQSFTDLYEKNGWSKALDEMSAFPTVSLSYKTRNILRRLENERRKALSLNISCWTLDTRKDGSAGENYLMWKAYSDGDVVCRIGTTIGQLINCIKKADTDILLSDVVYNSEWKLSPAEELIFRKRNFYEDEQEVRMVVLSNKNGVDVRIDSSILLNEVRISPFVPPVLGFFILGQLKKWCEKYKNVKVEYSKVMEYRETNNNLKSNKTLRL